MATGSGDSMTIATPAISRQKCAGESTAKNTNASQPALERVLTAEMELQIGLTFVKAGSALSPAPLCLKRVVPTR